MRILLVQAYLGRREPPVAPLGLVTLAALLPEHQVRIFDPNVAADPLPETGAQIEDFQPDLIGLSLRNIDTTWYGDQFTFFPAFRDYVKFISKASPSAEIIVGGSAFSLFPQRIMNLIPEIDLGFFREADRSFASFVNRRAGQGEIAGIYYRKGGEIKFSGPPQIISMDELPIPAWDLLNWSAYLPFTGKGAVKSAVGVETKRGCALKCAYCTYPQLNGSAPRLKAPARVARELRILQERFGVERIFFCDSVFNYPLQHAEAICREILNQGLKIKWGAYHQDRFLSSDYIALARQAGCDDFNFSPDSASEEGLRVLNKATTVKSLHRSLQLIAADGEARASYNFFASLPGTGWRNLLAALRFLLKARLRLGRRLFSFKFSYIRLEPGTPLCREVLGANGDEDAGFFLPETAKDLDRLYYRRSTSLLLNILLSAHYHLGKKWGRKNRIKDKSGFRDYHFSVPEVNCGAHQP